MRERLTLTVLLSLTALLYVVWAVMEMRDDMIIELDRRTQAEKERVHKELEHWFESTWSCKGFDIDRKCNIRQRN